ncbi:MAG: FlgO family outer membrane protein [Sulfurimonas sp.]|nr:FlgO family outer membrane protein [Sulfurimonas sp.]
MKKPILTILLSLSQLYAITFTGIGYGNTHDELKKNALADLSQNISTKVESNFKTITKAIDGGYGKDTTKVVELKSHLPIKSAKFTQEQDQLIATISTKDSLQGYLTQLSILKHDIDEAYRRLFQIKSDAVKYETLTKLLVYIDDFNSHKIVASMLGAKNLLSIDANALSVEKELYKLEEKVNSLKAAAKILTKKITQENIYIVPIKTDESSEVTQFAKVFKRQLMRKLDAVDKPKDAAYILRGTYEILNKEIFVSLKLLDDNNKIVNSANIKLSKKAYEQYKYKPKTKTIDEAFNSGNITNGNLLVQIAFKGYSRASGIDLSDGDVVDIYGKSNKDICYFLEGITVTKDKSYTYLIERNNGKFISYIEGDSVNKLIPLLSEIEISEPFGVETLMMFAQTLDKGKCNIKRPYCKVDEETGLCLLADKPAKNIAKTRAIFSKFNKKNTTIRKVESAEAVINFTTFK